MFHLYSHNVPCMLFDAEWWFSENQFDREVARSLCHTCPLRQTCLRTALEGEEPWGIWGGEILQDGEIQRAKRSRGRPRKDAQQAQEQLRRAVAARVEDLLGAQNQPPKKSAYRSHTQDELATCAR